MRKQEKKIVYNLSGTFVDDILLDNVLILISPIKISDGELQMQSELSNHMFGGLPISQSFCSGVPLLDKMKSLKNI